MTKRLSKRGWKVNVPADLGQRQSDCPHLWLRPQQTGDRRNYVGALFVNPHRQSQEIGTQLLDRVKAMRNLLASLSLRNAEALHGALGRGHKENVLGGGNAGWHAGDFSGVREPTVAIEDDKAAVLAGDRH